MRTITLQYDEQDKSAKKMIALMLSLGLAKRKKTGIEQALDEVRRGNLRTIHTPKRNDA